MSRIETAWQTRGWLACLLWPVSQIYRIVTSVRQLAFHFGWCKVYAVSLPVVVVGNLSVGGTGKTPLCGHLVELFRQKGWHPGIVSRGYGGERRNQPHILTDSDTPELVGDEPLMLFRQTDAPVCVCVDRAKAVEHLALHTSVDIVFSDDGLQHLSMPRVSEIVVVDGQRGLGNHWLLPAGPLRESPARLASVDLVAIQASFMETPSVAANRDTQSTSLESACATADPASVLARTLSANALKNTFRLRLSDAICLDTGKRCALSIFKDRQVYAMAGIGHPGRFFDALRQSGLNVLEIPKPDHHTYCPSDLELDEQLPVLVTSKDAVKLRALNPLPPTVFEVPATVELSAALSMQINELEHSLRSYR